MLGIGINVIISGMSEQPNATQIDETTKEAPKSVATGTMPHVDVAYDMYVDFVACGGMQVTEDGNTERLTMQQFCDGWNVERSTIWRRRQADDKFDEKVNERRKSIFGRDRVSAVWRGVMLRAMRGDAEQAKLFLANFDNNFVMPTMKVESTDSGLADFLQIMRRRQNAVDLNAAQEQLQAGQ